MKKALIFCLLLLSTTAFAQHHRAPMLIRTKSSSSGINSLTIIKQDMTLNGEATPWSPTNPSTGQPYFATSFNWYYHNNLASENSIGVGGTEPGGVYPNGANGIFPWYVIFSYGGNIATTNTRVQIRNIYIYYLSKSDNTWHLATGSNTAYGANDTYDTDTNVSTADLRNETTANGGGTSIKPTTSYCIQGWTNGSIGVVPTSDINGIWMYCEARLAVDNPALTDDRASANIILCPGADWKDTTKMSVNGGTVGGICAGRFKYVTNNWRAFNISTITNWTGIPTPPVNAFD